jgi:hypothetical protein
MGVIVASRTISPMSDNTPTLTHLLIPGAGLPADPEATRPPPAQPLPDALRALLQRMTLASTIACAEDAPSMPWELALARLQRLAPAEPGLVPWAAFETGTPGTPCAWIKPCFWRVGTDHVLLDDPAALALDESGSRALLAAAAPYFLEDGITLDYRTPGAWFATGEVFRGLPTLSLERVIGQRITKALFETSARHSPVLRRLQNEMQMLFYTHAVNDTRQAQGLSPVNSFWIEGAGMLAQVPPPLPGLVVEQRLRASALQRDAQAHAQAWRAVDADACVRLLDQAKQGRQVHLTLCGERRAQTFVSEPPSLARRFSAFFGAQAHARVLEQL